MFKSDKKEFWLSQLAYPILILGLVFLPIIDYKGIKTVSGIPIILNNFIPFLIGYLLIILKIFIRSFVFSCFLNILGIALVWTPMILKVKTLNFTFITNYFYMILALSLISILADCYINYRYKSR